jgi:hypothetical protein
MTLTLEKNAFFPGKYNNYLIGGNICNAFAIGNIGSTEDFFLVGSEPADESVYPSLTGNVLDSEGKLLFKLVRNVLVVNPGKCSKIVGDVLGYEIHDSVGVSIFAVRTQYTESDGYVTTIAGKFHDASGKLVFAATAGSSDEKIESTAPSAFGFTGQAFGLISNFSPELREVAVFALLSHGAISRILSGEITNKEVHLDGAYLRDVTITDCKIVIEAGQFWVGANVVFSGCALDFRGPAWNVAVLATKLLSSGAKPPWSSQTG